MAREPVAIGFVGVGGELGGAMGVARGGGGSRGGLRLARAIPGAPDVHPFAVPGQAMASAAVAVPEGFRNWADSRTGLCRPIPHTMAAERLRGKEILSAAGTASGDGSCLTREAATEGHSAGALNTHASSASQKANAVAAAGVKNGGPQVGQSPPRASPPPRSLEESNLVLAHALARPPATGKQPGTSQLTIFYAGTVNVYDEIPFDRAQAIMVLAGRARSWTNASGTNVPSSVAKSQPMSRAQSPGPQTTAKPECASLPNRPKPITAEEELPQARKKSLARFLERRKGRPRPVPYAFPTRSNPDQNSPPRQNPSQNSSRASSPSRSNAERPGI